MDAADILEQHGLRLDRICWGYRDIFARAIERLADEGLIGRGRAQVTRAFFSFLQCGERIGFDYVLKEFLGALNPRTRWLMDLPGIFTDVVDLGRLFAEEKLHWGTTFFKTLGAGGLGATPREVRRLLTFARRLHKVDHGLAFAFTRGYSRLLERLETNEIGRYLEQGLKVFANNRATGLRFMECGLRSSESIIRALTHECRLEDIKGSLAVLLRALVGYEIEVDHLGRLDSDDLIEHGSGMVCMYRWLYLPISMRHYQDARRNRDLYRYMGVIAAGMLSENSFCRVHGHPKCSTCRGLVGDRLAAINAFRLIEHARVFRRMRERWPGARRLLDFGLRTEFEALPAEPPRERLFEESMMPGEPRSRAARLIADKAASSCNCFDTAERLDPDFLRELAGACPDLARRPLRTFRLLPDFLFPGAVSTPPADRLIVDLKDAARLNRTRSAGREDEERGDFPASGDRRDPASAAVGDEAKTATAQTCFIYDEWSHTENDYHRDHCFVHERRQEAAGDCRLGADLSDQIRQTRRVFEQLKPELVRREKYLAEGQIINHDLLVAYLVQRRIEPAPKVNFYERPRVKQRDLAVLILMDVSGSTGEQSGAARVVEIEKQAAAILAHGLESLGDRFALCGFSGNGRENCEFLLYKDFDEAWGGAALSRLLSARPLSSTRIGAALRHAGYRLSQVEARQRLIMLITDGKPEDTGYDPASRYAQHDVRKACEENERQCIHTFCISTEENSLADMEIMFPRRRFAILSDIRRLPRVLPRLYIHMTI